ncbi:hypothetical protein BJ165DRAFT_1326496, partial [Panaeolus papilionaceus]
MVLPKGIATLEALATKNRTCMDNIFCSAGLEESLVRCRTRERDRVGKTDHFPIEIIFDMFVTRHREKERFNYQATNWEQFKTTLERGKISEFTQANEDLERALRETMEEVIPKTKEIPWKKRWWMHELGKCQKEMKRMGRRGERAWKRGEIMPQLEDEFRKKRNEY